MRKALLGVVLFTVCAVVLAQDKAEKEALSREEIDKLVAALGSEVWREREDAQEKLVKAGWAAGPALEKATKHEDPEIATRAERILKEIAYLTDTQKAEVDALYEKLKSRDEKERERAFDALLGKGDRVVLYLAKLLQEPSDNKVDIDLALEYSYVKPGSRLKYTINIKNAGKKPVWMPDFGSKIGGSYRQFGAESNSMTWSTGGGGRGDFRFFHLAPGEELSLTGEFRPHGGQVGIHTMVLRPTQEKGIEYTGKMGEEKFLPVAHYMPEKMPSAVVVVLPEIVEGETGKPQFGLVAGVKAKKTEVVQGEELPLDFTLKNSSRRMGKMVLKKFDYCWYMLVPTDPKKKFGAEGKLKMSSEPAQLVLEPDKSTAVPATVKADVAPGEYYLICGFTRRGEDEDANNVWRGELITNTLKLKVTAPEQKQEKPEKP
jgi:hypothetical protein